MSLDVESGLSFFGATMSDVHYLWSGWEPLAHIVVVGTVGYVILVLSLRISGSRSVGKTNLFDFIISVALGGVFARCLVENELSISEAALAFVLLIGLQYLVSLGRTHSHAFRKLVDNDPHVLFYRGQFIDRLMKKTRTTESDVHEAARLQGLGSLNEVEAVILEGNGDLSVIKKSDSSPELVHHVQKHDPSVFSLA